MSSALAMAQGNEEHSEFARNGFYIGGGGMYALEEFNDTGVLSFKDSEGFNFRLGYRFHPHFAIEAEGERVIGFDLKQATLDIETWTATLNAKVFALTGRIQPFGLVGIGAMTATADSSLLRSNITETGIAARFGGGADFYLTPNWLINAEITYVAPGGDVDDLDYVALGGGIQFRF
ncbi:MAG: porin family protein [Nitrospira sp.]|nr:porin family protein [Nitrospira sp.]